MQEVQVVAELAQVAHGEVQARHYAFIPSS